MRDSRIFILMKERKAMTIKAYMLRNEVKTACNYFFSRSRISVSNFSSLVGSGGAGAGAGAASSFLIRLFMALIIMKMANATIRKSIVVCMKAP